MITTSSPDVCCTVTVPPFLNGCQLHPSTDGLVGSRIGFPLILITVGFIISLNNSTADLSYVKYRTWEIQHFHFLILCFELYIFSYTLVKGAKWYADQRVVYFFFLQKRRNNRTSSQR